MVPRAFAAAWDQGETASAVLFQCLHDHVTGHITVVDGDAAWKKALGRWAQEHRCRSANFEVDKFSSNFFAAAWSPQRRERAVVCSCYGAKLPSVSFGAADTEEMDELNCGSSSLTDAAQLVEPQKLKDFAPTKKRKASVKTKIADQSRGTGTHRTTTAKKEGRTVNTWPFT